LLRKSIVTEEAPEPTGPYSQAILSGKLVFLSGQGPVRIDGSLVDGSFEDQARQVFDNLAAVARAAGGSLANAVKVGVFLRDMSHFDTMNSIYRTYFSVPLPARTTVQSDLPGFDIEVDAIIAIRS
jgi:2-iminobutanoate/2-iminopropanoate deaminase